MSSTSSTATPRRPRAATIAALFVLMALVPRVRPVHAETALPCQLQAYADYMECTLTTVIFMQYLCELALNERLFECIFEDDFRITP